jgi:hypothetical protein
MMIPPYNQAPEPPIIKLADQRDAFRRGSGETEGSQT